jgi:hypothetical protein
MKHSINICIDITDKELTEILQSAGYTVETIERVHYDKVYHNQLEERIETSSMVLIENRKITIHQAFEELYIPRIKDVSINNIKEIFRT